MPPYVQRWQAPSRLACHAAYQQWLLGLFLLGLLPRLVMLALQPDRLQFYEYEILAQNIVGGQGYVIPRFGHTALAFGDGNLYSFLAASVYLVVGHQPLLLAVVQAVIASLAAPVIFAIGARVFGWQVAGLGAGLAALHPGLRAATSELRPLGVGPLRMAVSGVRG